MTGSGAAVARLPRPVKLFGFVSLLNDFASEMIYPLLPAFVTGVLGAGPQALGALDGVAEFAASVVKFGAGRLADRTARRGPLIVLGYAIAVLVRPIIALTGAAWQVIGLRVVDRIGKGIRTPPRDALMADVTPAPLLGRAFGLQRGMDHAGAVLGPLTAWWLLTSGSADVRTVIGASLGAHFARGSAERTWQRDTQLAAYADFVHACDGMADRAGLLWQATTKRKPTPAELDALLPTVAAMDRASRLVYLVGAPGLHEDVSAVHGAVSAVWAWARADEKPTPEQWETIEGRYHETVNRFLPHARTSIAALTGR